MDKYEIKKIGNYKIELDSFSKQFIVSELNVETNSYQELKTLSELSDAEDYIDKREKRKSISAGQKKEPLLILKKGRGQDDFEEAKITSIDGNSAWIVTTLKKERSKGYSLSGFIKNTKENKEKLDKIKELEKKEEDVKESIEKYTESEINKHFDI